MRPSSEQTTAVLDGLRRLVKVLREGSREAEQAMGLSGAQLFVLEVLSEAEAVSLSELAERTHTHQSSVSVVVSRLVRRGLVRRVRAREDARRLVLGLSPRGRALQARAPHAAQRRLIDAVEALSATQRRQLGSSLGRLAELMKLPAAAPAMFFEEGRR